MSDSRQAYNGCLSLYSKEERIHRGFISFYIYSHDLSDNNNNNNNNNKKNYNKNNNNKNNVMGKEFKEFLFYQKQERKENEIINKYIKTKEDTLDEMIEEGRNKINYSNEFCFIYNDKSYSKIQILEDSRSFDNLITLFTYLPVDFITVVWSTQETWNACYDILSTFQNKHDTTFLFDFQYDPISWPTLQSAYPKKQLIYTSNNQKNRQRYKNHQILIQTTSTQNSNHSELLTINENDHEEQSIKYEEEKMSENGDVISLTSSNLSGFSWHITKKENDYDFEEIESVHSETSWELLSDENDFRKSEISHNDNNSNNSDNSDNNENNGEEEEKKQENDNDHETVSFSIPILSIPSPSPSPITITTKSYKDALLTEPPITTSFYFNSTTNQTKQNKTTLPPPPPPTTTTTFSYLNFYSTTPYFFDDFDDYIGETDTYVDWLESAYGSKFTSPALINRIKTENVKKSHNQKKKSKGTYSKKYAK